MKMKLSVMSHTAVGPAESSEPSAIAPDDADNTTCAGYVGARRSPDDSGTTARRKVRVGEGTSAGAVVSAAGSRDAEWSAGHALESVRKAG
ncbi:hypothetical protein GCM10009634_09930 [Saccharothrix xinjiangensis]